MRFSKKAMKTKSKLLVSFLDQSTLFNQVSLLFVCCFLFSTIKFSASSSSLLSSSSSSNYFEKTSNQTPSLTYISSNQQTTKKPDIQTVFDKNEASTHNAEHTHFPTQTNKTNKLHARSIAQTSNTNNPNLEISSVFESLSPSKISFPFQPNC